MAFLLIGLVLLILKWLELGPVATWSWWWVLAPFAAAVLWWQWADSSGYTKRRAMEKEAARKAARLEKARRQLNPHQGRGH
jgi:small Trp-rich protein